MTHNIKILTTSFVAPSKNADDCSGRAVKGVHVNAYGDGFSTLVEK